MQSIALHGSNNGPQQGLALSVSESPVTWAAADGARADCWVMDEKTFVLQDYGQYTLDDFYMCFYLAVTWLPDETFKHHTPTWQHKRRSDQMKLDLAGPAEDISRQQGVNRNFTGKGQCAEREVFLVFAHLKGPIVVLDLPSCSATRYAGSGGGPTDLT